jgi:murein DD-endopeptidase MepM/ murein hydrolase activator NlpD
MRAPELGESLAQLEVALRQKENELSILEALLTDRELHQKQYPQGWPTASGWMSSAYGKRTDPFTGRTAFHEGVDIAARDGSEIRAMAAGVVTFAGNKSGYGLVVEINHGNGFQTRYAHAKKVIAEVGDRVEKGDTVALVGSTGRSTGSHVHFEVIKNGKVVNPHEHLNASG